MPDNMTTLPPRQDISAAWLGRDLAKHPEKWTVTLSPDHVAELERAMAEAVSRGMQMSDITDDNFTLPSLGPVLTALQQELLHGRGLSAALAIMGAQGAVSVYSAGFCARCLARIALAWASIWAASLARPVFRSREA